MLSGLDRDALHSAIAKFIQHELDEAKEKVALLNQQGSQQAENVEVTTGADFCATHVVTKP